MKSIKKCAENVKNMLGKEENKRKIKACETGILIGTVGYLGYKVGCTRAINKISNEFYIILEGKNDLKNALKDAVDETISS